jgi:hypothetical protein
MEPTNSRALVKLLLTTGLGEIPAMPGEDIGSDPELLAMLTEASVDRANTYAREIYRLGRFRCYSSLRPSRIGTR